jgi:hypothetical protein
MTPATEREQHLPMWFFAIVVTAFALVSIAALIGWLP